VRHLRFQSALDKLSRTIDPNAVKIFAVNLFIILFAIEAISSDKVPPRSSASYDIVKGCRPEFVKAIQASSFSLDVLKEKIDQIYPTLNSIELEKQWLLNEPGSRAAKAIPIERRRLTLRTRREKSLPVKVLSFEKLDSQDAGEVIPIPPEHQKNPPQEVINSYLFKYDISQELLTKKDVKSKGRELEYQRTDDGIVFLNFTDPADKISLRCQKKSQLGVVCFCDKK